MKIFKRIPFLISLVCYSGISFASGTPTLDQITQAEASDISKEFAANFMHSTVSPAAGLGTVFGIEVGLMAGVTTAATVERVSKRVSSSSSVKSIPTAALMAGVTVPFGISADLNVIPKITTSGVSLQNLSFGGKFTFTSLIPNAPFDMAIKGFVGTGELTYSTIVNNSSTSNQNVQTKATWKNTTVGYHLLFSKRFLYVFEPYIGIGRVSATTDIGLSASTTVSIFTFSNSSSYQSKNSGTQTLMGINLNLFLAKLGFEYSKAMGVDRYAGKFSLWF